MKLILHGDQINSKEDFHSQIKRLLNFPDYYGENLDALWDCLTTLIDKPITIIWENFETSKKKLGGFAETALNIFKDAEKDIPNFKIEYD